MHVGGGDAGCVVGCPVVGCPVVGGAGDWDAGGAADVAGGATVGDGRAGAVVVAGLLAAGVVAERGGEVVTLAGLGGRAEVVADGAGVAGGMFVPGLAGSGD
jgi:hypothetical protein